MANEIKAIRVTDMVSPAPVVTRDKSGFIDLHRNGAHHYWISESEVSTVEGLVNKIHHLCSKRWITNAHIEQLIDTSREIIKERNFRNTNNYATT